MAADFSPNYVPPVPQNADAPTKSKEQIASEQAALLALGATVGAATHKAWMPTHAVGDRRNPPIAVQVGSAMGAAAIGGAGFSGTVAAGTAVVTAKIAAATVVATAAAPFVLGAAAIGAVGYGLFKLFSDED